MRINRLELENVKRIKAVSIEPKKSGLTIIGGKNNQGKTSVLDAIAWALGGEKYRPSQASRDGSMLPPNLKIVMDNGLVVERKGKNSSLKVTDPSGKKAGQQLLNEFIEELALNLPRFMEASNKEKSKILLQILGIGKELAELEQEEISLYNKRHAIGQIADQKSKFAKEQPFYPDMPEELVSPADLIRQQQDILARNGENQRKRDRLKEITFEKHRIYDEAQRLEQQIKDLQDRLQERKTAYEKVAKDEEIAMTETAILQDESTAELEKAIRDIDEVNRKIRANLDKERAEEEAKEYKNQYDTFTASLQAVRDKKMDLLNGADLPLPELSVKEGELIYKGRKWDTMSGSDQLKVATAIVRKLNPKCGFVLMDKLEQMDTDTLQEFGEWLQNEDLQVIATRVSTGGECSIIIEDGYVRSEEPASPSPAKKWKAGEF